MITRLAFLAIPLVAAGLFAGCGNDADENNGSTNNGASEEPTCAFETTLSGAVEEAVEYGESQGCGGASSGTLLTFTFGSFSDTSMVVGTSGEAGMTATGVDAYVTYRNADGDEWTSRDCTVDITRNDLLEEDPEFGDVYVLGGTGSCSTAAEATQGDATGEVTIADFSFTVEVPF